MNIKTTIAGLAIGFLAFFGIIGCAAIEPEAPPNTTTQEQEYANLQEIQEAQNTPTLTKAERAAGLLESAGVSYSSPESVEKVSEYICELLESGDSPEYVIGLMVASDANYSPEDLGAIYAAAVVVYCPEFQ